MWLKTLPMSYAEVKIKKEMGNMRNSKHGNISHPGPAEHLDLMSNHTQTTLSMNDYRRKRNKDKNQCKTQTSL